MRTVCALTGAICTSTGFPATIIPGSFAGVGRGFNKAPAPAEPMHFRMSLRETDLITYRPLARMEISIRRPVFCSDGAMPSGPCLRGCRPTTPLNLPFPVQIAAIRTWELLIYYINERRSSHERAFPLGRSSSFSLRFRDAAVQIPSFSSRFRDHSLNAKLRTQNSELGAPRAETHPPGDYE